MLRSSFRVFFALAVSLSLALGVFAGVGITPVLAADQPEAAAGYQPDASVPPEVDYCYPTGYNRNGWRCGWRLAQAPYNLGDYYRYYYGYNWGYYNWGYYNWGNSGTGGYPPVNGDYGGRPRFQPYYYGGYYYNPCYYYNYPYCK